LVRSLSDTEAKSAPGFFGVSNSQACICYLRVFRNEPIIQCLEGDPGELSQSGCMLRDDVIRLCGQVISLLRSCVVSSQYLRGRLATDESLLSDALTLLTKAKGESVLVVNVRSNSKNFSVSSPNIRGQSEWHIRDSKYQ